MNISFVLLPYLVVTEDIEIDNFILRPINNISGLDDSEKKILSKICRFFPITPNSVYVKVQLKSKNDWLRLKEEFDKLTTILRYIHLQKGQGTFENFDYFVFEATREAADDKKHQHFQAVLNGLTPIYFYIHEGEYDRYSLIDNTSPLFIGKDILNHPVWATISGLLSVMLSSKDLKKMIRSMYWFNRSFIPDKEVDNSDSLVNVVTAFESLLTTEARDVKSQLVNGICLLLGETEEIKHWIEKLWKIRCSLVHGNADIPSPFYIAKGGNKESRAHLFIARKVFAKCVEVVVAGRSQTYVDDVKSLLTSNEIRINNASMKLKKASYDIKKAYENGAFKDIDVLREDELSASKDEIKKFGDMFIPLLKQDDEAMKISGIADTVQKVMDWKGKDLGELALFYADLHKAYSDFYLGQVIHGDMLHIHALRSAIFTFTSFATWRLLVFFD